MFAIVDFLGSQIRIEKDAIVKVPFIAKAEAGTEVKMETVLLVNDGTNVSLGQPTIASAFATGEVVKHGRDKKIIVFKKKKRKGYRKTQGHRQDYTEIKIKSINL